MSDGFFCSYHLCWSRPDAESLLADLEAAGIRADHPVTRRITLISPGAGPAGTQSFVTRDQLVLLAGLQRLDRVDFLLWLPGGDAIHVRIGRGDDGAVELRFALGPLDRADEERLVRAIREAIGRASLLCVGFVLDREGASAATDWAGFIVKAAVYFDCWPDTLAVLPEVAAAQPQLSGVNSFEQSPWTVYGSDVPNR
ncbi:hypothetical protein [Streptomyces sp. NPDC057689]|uniref:hypothetical protein n=1 Tax=Streptomyces sp. NPDC057689 TaxID=3346213 RepID=UPI0036C0357C